MEEVENQEGGGAPSSGPQDYGRGKGDQRRAVGVGSSLLEVRHPQQLEQIESVFGQSDGGREQPHGGVPHRWLEERVPLQNEHEQKDERKPSPAASFEDLRDGCKPCQVRRGCDFGGGIHRQ